MLLALEGIAGAGKSTLRDRLLSLAEAQNIQLGHIGQFSWLAADATRTIVGLRAGRPAANSEDAITAARRNLELHARHNLAPALSLGSVVADRLTLSTACLLALLHERPVAYYVQQLSAVTTARADLTVLLITEPALCHARLARRKTPRRFGEELPTATRLAGLYEQAATAWTETTALPVIRSPCTTEADLDRLAANCLERLREAPTRTARI
jgi:thymidylate kinase